MWRSWSQAYQRRQKIWQRQKLLCSWVLWRLFRNFSMSASYTNCFSNTFKQQVPLLRTLQSAFLMGPFNWIRKTLCIDYILRLHNIAQLLLFSEFPKTKAHAQRMFHESQKNSWDTRFSTLQQILRLSHCNLLWSKNPKPNIKLMQKLKNSKIFSFNAIKMFNSTGVKPFFV